MPTAASAKSAIGSTQIGRFSDSRKRLRSSVGATAISQMIAKMPTSDVDQGSESAIRTATISAVLAHAAGSRQAGSAGLASEASRLGVHAWPSRAR